MDDFSVALNNSGIGGYLGDAFLNHLCYADDLCLISLSSDNIVRYYKVHKMSRPNDNAVKRYVWICNFCMHIYFRRFVL